MSIKCRICQTLVVREATRDEWDAVKASYPSVKRSRQRGRAELPFTNGTRPSRRLPSPSAEPWEQMRRG